MRDARASTPASFLLRGLDAAVQTRLNELDKQARADLWSDQNAAQQVMREFLLRDELESWLSVDRAATTSSRSSWRRSKTIKRCRGGSGRGRTAGERN